jgi:DNA-binding PadR family transcriptional regulator
MQHDLRYIDSICHAATVPRRRDALDFAVLGALVEGPLHGYELRKHLASVLGPFRALSFGSLYPCLRRLQAQGLISEASVDALRRSRIVYSVTQAGGSAFAEWANRPSPDAWDDTAFETHFAFFSSTDTKARLRILEGRRTRLEERLAATREAMTRRRDRADAYVRRLQEHALDTLERELAWLTETITLEHKKH